MKTRNVMFSLATLAIALFLVATVSAGEITNDYTVEIENINAYNNVVSVVAGETIKIEVYFNSLVDDSDVTVEAEIEGEKVKVDTMTSSFDVEAGFAYRKVLTLKVPYELKDQLSDMVYLNIEIDGKDHKTELEQVKLLVQRPSYNAVVKSLSVPSSIEAGDKLSVEFVLKNMGYNDLDDVYVKASITELGLSQGPVWVGDLVTMEECNDDDCDKDTVAGKLYLDVPFSAKEGVYDLEFTVYNDDTETTEVKQIVIKNDFSNEVIATNTEKTVAVGEKADFTLLLVNPSDNVKVYTILIESDGITTELEESVVAVGAGSSKTVQFSALAKSEGSNDFTVSVLSNGKVVQVVDYNLTAEGKKVNSTVILSIILAIIFVVLLVVLIVLLAKKPEKNTEDFGESYY
ncbi:MAG: hypothetical protein WC812_02715 [Candidatus Pacearchaeota archaeon]